MANLEPAHKIDLGAIKATISWNKCENGPSYSVTLTRHYKDGEDWKTTDSRGRDDLACAGGGHGS